jgi:flagellin-like hook-associated protein FlgL
VLAAGAVIAASLVGAPGTAAAAAQGAPVQVAAQVAATPADAPFNVTDQITDRAGVLGDVAALQGDLDRLRTEHGLQLFVVYVNSFDGASGESWAQQTFAQSGMGGDDVLMAVAVKDRRYGTYTTSESGLTAEEDSAVRSQFIEPELADDDWAGAVRAAVQGYGRAAAGDIAGDEGGDSGGGGFPWWLVLPAGGVALFALFRWRRSRRESQLSQGPPGVPAPLPTEELRRRAAAALVEVDDAIRSSAEELAFAEAQFGVQATRRFKEALETARANAGEAFRLQRQLDDEEAAGQLDEATRRARLERIIELAWGADQSLDAQEAEFVRLRDLQATIPEFLVELRLRLGEVRRRLPVAEQELAGLAAQYPAAALRTVSGNVTQAQQLLASAEGFVDTGEEHLREGDARAAAVAAARAAEEAIGQADQLLTSVNSARQELASASARIDAALTSISSDVADAERLGANDQLTQTALTAAREAIALGTAARDGGDPLAALRALGRAEKDLDNALARYRAEEERAERSRQLLEQRLAQVRARLASIDELISSRRGAVGSRARMHIANAFHLYDEAASRVAGEPVQAGALLDQAEAEGEQALRNVHDDINSWGGPGGPGGPGGTRAGPRGLDLPSLILGGILSGGFGGFGGGGRGGGWGGSRGGFGGDIGGGFGGGGRF